MERFKEIPVILKMVLLVCILGVTIGGAIMGAKDAESTEAVIKASLNEIHMGYADGWNAYWTVTEIEGKKFVIVTRGKNGIAITPF